MLQAVSNPICLMMQPNYFTRSRLFLLQLLLVLSAVATPSFAESYQEGFESCTGSEDYLTTLPQGWSYIGSLRDFGLGKRYYKTSQPSVSYTSGGNTSDYLVTPVVSGTVTFWYYGTNSRTKGSLQVYECIDQEGQLSVGEQIGSSLSTPCQTWTQYSVTLTSAKRLAILMSRTAIDDFYAESTGDEGGDTPPAFVEKKSLQMLAFERVGEGEVAADTANKFTVEFAVRVKNTSNVKLAAKEVSVSLTNRDGSMTYATQSAEGFDSLAIDGETQIKVKATVNAGQNEYWSFYAKENVTGTFMLDNGSAQYINVRVKPYYALFAIMGPDGYALWSDETIDFGYTNGEVTRQLTILNDGTAPLAVSSIVLPEGFTASEQSFAVEAGGQKSVVLTLKTGQDAFGTKGGEAVITHALGTFTFAVSGTTVDPSKYFVSFDSGTMPESWTAETGWSVSSTSNGNYYAVQNSNSGASALTTQKLTVAAGETLSLQVRRAYSYTAATLSVLYSPTGSDDSWVTARNVDAITSAFQTVTLANIPAGSYYLRFVGHQVAIDNIIGFAEATDMPQLAFLGPDGKALQSGAEWQYGTATADSTLVFTLKNVGTGMLRAQLSVGDGFAVTPATVELNAGETQPVSLTMQAEPYGAKAGVLTIAGEGFENFTLQLGGFSRDPELLFVDFQDKQWPRGWQAEGKWAVSWQSFGSENYWAEHVDHTNTVSSLTTAKVQVKAGDALVFDAGRQGFYTSTLRISRSADRLTWNGVADVTQQLTDELSTIRIDNLPEGEYYLRFEGANVQLDNITGVHLAQAEAHQLVVSSFVAPDSCEVNETITISVGITNLWADSETVTASLYINGNHVGSEQEKAIALGKEQTYSFSYTPRQAADSVSVQIVCNYDGGQLFTEKRYMKVKGEREDQYAHTLSGVVTDPDRQPLEGVSITLKAQVGDAQYEGVSDAEGKFSIRVIQGLYPYSLTASKEGYNDTTFVIGFGGSDIENQEIILSKPSSTGIAPLPASVATSARYDLSGRKATRPLKGILLRNGRKIIVKQ